MEAGKLRHRVGVEALTTATLDDGSVTRTWAVADTVWASVRPLRGTELFEADQMKATGDHKVRLRHYAGLRPQQHRFSFDGRTLNIVSISNLDERGITDECLCREEP